MKINLLKNLFVFWLTAVCAAHFLSVVSPAQIIEVSPASETKPLAPGANVFVNNTNDSGVGSLRGAIVNANPNDTIVFNPAVFNVPQTITLTSAQIVINKPLTINGTGARLLTIAGQDARRVFEIGAFAVTINDLTVADGSAAQGGAINLPDGGTLTLNRVAVTGSAATAFGGGINLQNGGNLTLNACTVSGNTVAIGGGGIAVQSTSRVATVSIINTTVSENTVSGSLRTGGGLLNLVSSVGISTVTLLNSTVTNNTISAALNGAGVSNVRVGGTATVNVKNTIVAANIGNSQFNTEGGASTVSQGNNLVSDNSLPAPQASDRVNTNPLLLPLGNYGGATDTHRPRANSPAINNGANTGAPAADQRGTTRPQNGAVDIGAVETVVATVTTNADAGAGSLREALTTLNADVVLFQTGVSFITLTSEIDITGTREIVGAGANLLTIAGGGTNRIFDLQSGSFLLLSGATLQGGSADFGGAINTFQARLEVSEAVFQNNTAIGGGAIMVAFGSTATVSNSTFRQNTATGGAANTPGGAILVSCATLNATGSTFNQNTGINGAAVGNVNACNPSAATINLTNNTIHGNSAINGGGINLAPGATAALNHNTITGNTSVNLGGGILHGSGVSLSLRNTIVAENTSNDGADIKSFSGFTSQGNNLVGDITNSGMTTAAGDLVGTTAAPLSPNLAPLGNYGGATETRVVNCGFSPIFNAGSATGAPATDQRGRLRNTGGAPDIGATEVNGAVVTSTLPFGAGTLQSAATNAAVEYITFQNSISVVDSFDIVFSGTKCVVGRGVNNLSVSGLNVNRVFTVPADANVTIVDLSVINGRASGGGGGISNSGNLTLNRVVVRNSINSGGSGGGILNGGNLTLNQSVVSSNSAFHGGGISVISGGFVNIFNSLIADNLATGNQGGGGLAVIGATVNLTNTTVSGNVWNVSSGGQFAGGAGIVNLGTATLNLTNVTVTNNRVPNTATNGGGVFNTATGTTNIRNTIIAGNQTQNNQKVDAGGAFTSFGNNLIGSATGTTGFTQPTDLIGTDDTPLDARLLPLGDYGGATQTNIIAHDSPAVNAGATVAGITTDQRGVPRPFGSAPDIGAVESIFTFTPAALPSATVNVTYSAQTVTAAGGAFPLVFSISSGALPTGLTLVQNSPTTATVSGTPTATGKFDFVVRATGADGIAGAIAYSITVGCPPQLVTNTNDAGAGSLRAALTAACVGATEINFDAGFFNQPRTITLTSAELNVNRSVVVNGTGARRLTVSGGGGRRVFNFASGTTSHLKNLTVSGGGSVVKGAGIANLGTLTLTDTVIKNNTADIFGGGISNEGILTMRGGLITGNTSQIGGGFTNGTGSLQTGVNARFENVTISGNTAAGGSPSGGGGGGLAGVLTLVNVTAVNNSYNSNLSETAGGINCSSNAVCIVRNTIIAGNSRANGAPDAGGAFTSLGNNLIGKIDGSTGFNQPTDLTGTIAAPRDARIAPLGNYGGATDTHALFTDSPAVNAGATVAEITTDARGISRPAGAAFDIGAFENSMFAAALETGLINAPYARAINVTGGTAPRTLDILSGNLPAGLTLQTDGAFSGTPTTAGTSNFVVRATDANGFISLFSLALGITNSATWTGAANSDWHDAANWSPQFAPVTGNDVTIPSGNLPNEPVISTANANAANLSLAFDRLLQIGGGRTLNVANSANINGTLDIIGDFAVGGAFATTGSTIRYKGTSPQTIIPAIYNNLAVNNAAGATAGGNITVNNLFAIVNGTVVTNANNVTLGARGKMAGGSTAFLIGNLTKQFGGAENFIFEVGTPGGYSPVNVSVTGGTGALTVRTTAAAHPTQLFNFSLHRFWTLNASGNLTADLTFKYLDADVFGNEANYRIFRIENNVPQSFPNNCAAGSPCVNTADNTATIRSVSQFSDWTLAEAVPTAANVIVGGRVSDVNGQAVARAIVTLTDANGAVRSVRTNSFGVYRFEEVAAGAVYVVAVQSKGYDFAPQIVTVTEAREDLDFTGVER